MFRLGKLSWSISLVLNKVYTQLFSLPNAYILLDKKNYPCDIFLITGRCNLAMFVPLYWVTNSHAFEHAEDLAQAR